ncbi:substrate-binding domain-containing protein [Planococcus shenhongbingii]|uniref:Substrate-binding domain-containing protein n=1 Tax=Planococcus shenhongbingii TaxID=3058398 RepID=A0ABT8NBX7_9BACL|nr:MULTISPECIES: substrate-binding domain-containing protein [unclassified Planococcus (in: firmicutes)]MDN7245387.1 substrate-binding domain-containing protein [Planococcus sp. N017]WKA58489.1 substrate-binding domain-containing protein [Planococcus sp. N016]
MKKQSLLLLTILLIISAFLAACQPKGEGSEEKTPDAAKAEASDNPLAGKKVALIMQQNLGTFSAQYIEGVEEQVGKFGGDVTVFTSDGDLAKMASNLDAAINQGFDGILIDHGTKEALNQGVEKAVEKGIPVVAFDAGVDVEGVVSLEQGDQQMAEMTLEKLANDHDGKANIVKIWVAGFAPMERRQVAYEEFLKNNTGIKEVTAFGAATQNTALDTQAQMEAVLKQYPNEGEITAVWAAWDEFAKGAVRAIEQSGRTDISVYSIDMSDEDLQMIQKDGSPWAASAAVDPVDIGRIQVRYLYQQINGENPEQKVVLEPIFVDAEKLPEEAITTAELSEYIEGWGASEQGYTDGLKKLENK